MILFTIEDRLYVYWIVQLFDVLDLSVVICPQ
jgi:hypothetical protein